jgi:hypothetical protein
MAILHFITLIVLIIVDALVDNYLIKKKENVHTLIQYIIREGGFILLARIFAPSGDNQYALYSWVLTHFVYWCTLNIIRKKPLIYMSDRGIDQYQRPEIVWFIFKGVFAIAASLYFLWPELYAVNY